MMKPIKIKRIYEAVSDQDGYRILVDRIWPRGVSKMEAKLDEWDKEMAPSTELRKWFDHQEERFGEFEMKYIQELQTQEVSLNRIREIAATQQVTLLYAAKDTHFNQAVVLKNILNTTL